MTIIREEELGFSIYMTGLLINWGLRRCNIENCEDEPTTIIAGEDARGAPVYALCERHWLFLSSEEGDVAVRLVWDEFDAFAATSRRKEEKKHGQVSQETRRR